MPNRIAMAFVYHHMCTPCRCGLLFTTVVFFCPFIAFSQDMLPSPIGLYPFNNLYKTADASCYGNLHGMPQDVELVGGPFHKQRAAYQFTGTSCIHIPGSRHLNENIRSITILVWIFQTGHAGSIVNFNSNESNEDSEAYGRSPVSVEIRTSGSSSFSADLAGNDGRRVHLWSNSSEALANEWRYIGVSYDHSRREVIMWIDDEDVDHLSILKNLDLSTDRSIQIGGRQGKQDSFEGRISCLQVYDRALSKTEVKAVRNRCFRDNQAPVDCSKIKAPEHCGLFLNTLSGRFSSPGYPTGYPYNAKCVWEIKVPKGYFITLKFEYFDLGDSSCADHVLVRDGINSWSKKIMSVCGGQDVTKLVVSSFGSGMRVEFVSDKQISASGFLASYTSHLIASNANNEDDRLDFSRHYTGIVIGVACAAIFAIFSVIAFSHARSRLRERRSGRSLTRSNRQSVSFPEDDVIQLNAPPTYDDVMRYPELYPPTPLQGSLTNTPVETPRMASPVSTPSTSRRVPHRPGSPAVLPNVGTPIGMPLFNPRRLGQSTSHTASRVSLQRGVSPLARAEFTPQISRQTDHVSTDELNNSGEDEDDELPPYPGTRSVDSVLDQVRETLQYSGFASGQASNPSLSDNTSVDGNQTRIAIEDRGSQASVTLKENSGVIETTIASNRNSATSVQTLENTTQEHANPWVSSISPRIAAPPSVLRSVESVV